MIPPYAQICQISVEYRQEFPHKIKLEFCQRRLDQLCYESNVRAEQVQECLQFHII